MAVLIVKKVMPWIAWAVSLFIPGRKSRLALLEARNKALIIALVDQVETFLPSKGTYRPLGELVSDCYRLGDFSALWAVEGLGNYYAETFRERNLPLENLLTDPALADLPSKSMTMLHAGIGMSFAKRSLEGLTARSPREKLRAAAERFLSLCQGPSRPGYFGAACESLGLVTLILHNPAMAQALDPILQELDPESRAFMWRGAGRALYFHPKNFIPGFKSPWRGIELARQISTDEVSYRNLRAGIAWATTVVNMRHPEIMESVLLHQGENDPDRPYFIDGITSAMIMRYDTSPEDPNIAAFVEHKPDPSNKLLCYLWERDIRRPCYEALDIAYQVLVENHHLDQVFRFRSLPHFINRAARGIFLKPGIWKRDRFRPRLAS